MSGVRVGNLNGIPVYRISMSDWNLYDTKDDECFYWVTNRLFYHDVRVGTVTETGNVDLDEGKYRELQNAWAYQSSCAEEEEVPAETRPVEEDTIDDVVAEPVSAEYNTEIVDATLRQAGWSVTDMLKDCNMAANNYLEEVKGA